MALDLSLYLITERSFLKNKNIKEAVEESILGGVTLVQVREKNISSRLFFNISREIKQVTDYYKIPLIINDRIDIAQAINAAGVHLGQSDIDLVTARKILGSEKIIGISTGNIMEALHAQRDGADYVGIGAIYPTGTKKDASDPIGLNGLKSIVDSITLPSVAIGGINQNNFKDVLSTGVNGISVISAILNKDDIKQAARDLKITK